jgi:phospholipase C
MNSKLGAVVVAFCLSAYLTSGLPAFAEGNLHKVNHIIIVMQENHSFDNYFGVLPYVAGTPLSQVRQLLFVH